MAVQKLYVVMTPSGDCSDETPQTVGMKHELC